MSIKTKILRQLEQQPCTRAALKARLGNDKKVAKALAQLCEKNKVLCREGVYALCTEQAQHAVPCTLVKLARGFGFARPASGGPDVFIPGRFLRGAMPGDEVLVSLFGHPQKEGSAEGEVLAVTKEQNRFAGTVERREGRLVFLPDVCPALCLVLKKGLDGGAREGEKVAVELLERGGTHEAHRAGVAMRFGSAQSARACAKAILYEADIETHFSTKAKDEAKALAAAGISEQELHGRLDLRGEAVFTIDSADTKDIDDAVSIARRPGGFSLGVHIADVSHYVKRGSPIDVEAYKRGTSVYFPDRVLPMLPKELSNGLCSLNPDEDKLTLSCVMDIDSHGKVVHHNIAKSVIRSNYRMTYDEVNAIFAGDPDMAAKYSDIMPMLGEMRRLKDILKAKRQRRGAIDFDLPEADIHLDGNGRAVGVSLHIRGEANMMIEEFMLAANETVARDGVDKGLPLMYRVHEAPDPERIKELNTFLHTLGYGVGNAEKVQPADVRKMLLKAAGSSEERVINNVTLRAMTKAKYSPDCDGHFGLAAKYYCHFTSPIRRYPDLLVHRALNESLEGRLDEENLKRWKAYLPGASDQCSGREVTATEAERAADDLKKCEYMAQHIGEEYQGVISGVTQGGFFVELGNTVEGRVKVESLSGDRYEWDEKGYRLVGRFTGLQYRLGDEVKVRAVSADMETSRIEFELIEEKPHKAPRESPKRSGHGSTRGRNGDKIKALKSKKGGHGFGHSKRHQKGRGKSKGTP